ncbi:unnamed protein product [Brassica oleracea]
MVSGLNCTTEIDGQRKFLEDPSLPPRAYDRPCSSLRSIADDPPASSGHRRVTAVPLTTYS